MTKTEAIELLNALSQDKDLSALRQEVLSEAQKVSLLQQQVASDTRSVSRLREEVASEAESVSDLRREIASEAEGVSRIRREMKSEVGNIPELRQRLTSEAENAARLRQQIQAEAQNVAELRQDAASEANRASSLREVLASETQGISAFRAEVASEASNVSELRRELTSEANAHRLYLMRSLRLVAVLVGLTLAIASFASAFLVIKVSDNAEAKAQQYIEGARESIEQQRKIIERSLEDSVTRTMVEEQFKEELTERVSEYIDQEEFHARFRDIATETAIREVDSVFDSQLANRINESLQRELGKLPESDIKQLVETALSEIRSLRESDSRLSARIQHLNSETERLGISHDELRNEAERRFRSTDGQANGIPPISLDDCLDSGGRLEQGSDYCRGRDGTIIGVISS